jgi:hypothetical protein
MCSAGRTGIEQRVDKQKSQNHHQKGPIQDSVGVPEPGEVVESREQNSCPEVQEKQEPRRLGDQSRKGSADVRYRVEQADGVE